MKERSFDEMIAYFNRRVSEMDIARDYKIELLGMIAALGYKHEKTAQQWIPCSERLPEERGFYLVSVGAPYKTVRVYEYKPCEGYENKNLWKNDDGSYCFNWFVEAWMPLPEPYKGGREE